MTSAFGSAGAALGSALGYAVASVLQHREARGAPRGTGLRIRLLFHLATRPVWLVGLAFAGVGLVLHGLALSMGQLAVVQPLLLSGLLFALPASMLLDRRRPSLAEWLWALTLVAAIAAFLLSSRPTAHHGQAANGRLGYMVLAGAFLAALTTGLGRSSRRHAAFFYGLAAGVAYGLTAALIKRVASSTSHPVQLLSSWPVYVLVVIGAAALVLNQAAYQAGPLVASLPPLTMSEPIVATVIGVAAFNEHLAHGPLALLAEAASGCVVAYATIQLARRAGAQDGYGGRVGSLGGKPPAGQAGSGPGGAPSVMSGTARWTAPADRPGTP